MGDRDDLTNPTDVDPLTRLTVVSSPGDGDVLSRQTVVRPSPADPSVARATEGQAADDDLAARRTTVRRQDTDDGLPSDLARRFPEHEMLHVGGDSAVYLVGAPAADRSVLRIQRGSRRPGDGVIRFLDSADPDLVICQLDAGTSVDGDRYWQQLEYARHGDLGALMSSDSAWVWSIRDEIRDFLLRVGVYLERRGIVHQDLKPSNILVRSLDPLRLAVTDFGIARALGVERTQVFDEPNRTELYAPPEATTSLISPAWDWWSIGMMLVELELRSHPYEALYWKPTQRRLDEDQLRQDRWVRALDLSGVDERRVRELCAGLLHKDKDQRWGAAEVEDWREGREVPADLDQGAPIATASVEPYEYDGRSFADPGELAVYFAEHWASSRQYLLSGVSEAHHPLRVWAADHQELRWLGQLLHEVSTDQRTDDLRLLRFITHAAPGHAPAFRSYSLARQELPALARSLRAPTAEVARAGVSSQEYLKELVRINGALDIAAERHEELRDLSTRVRTIVHIAEFRVETLPLDYLSDDELHLVRCEALELLAGDVDLLGLWEALRGLVAAAAVDFGGFQRLTWWPRVVTLTEPEQPGEANRVESLGAAVALRALLRRAVSEMEELERTSLEEFREFCAVRAPAAEVPDSLRADLTAWQPAGEPEELVRQAVRDPSLEEILLEAAESFRQNDVRPEEAQALGLTWYSDAACGRLTLSRAAWVNLIAPGLLRDDLPRARQFAEYLRTTDERISTIWQALDALRNDTAAGALPPRSLYERSGHKAALWSMYLFSVCFYGVGFAVALVDYARVSNQTWTLLSAIRRRAADIEHQISRIDALRDELEEMARRAVPDPAGVRQRIQTLDSLRDLALGLSRRAAGDGYRPVFDPAAVTPEALSRRLRNSLVLMGLNLALLVPWVIGLTAILLRR